MISRDWDRIEKINKLVEEAMRGQCDGETPLTRRDCLPSKIGVYIVFRKKFVVYIGKSINIYQRLKRHNKMSEFKELKCTHISWLLTDTENTALSVEKILIQQMMPLLNNTTDEYKITCTKAERDEIERLAGEAGQSISDYLRSRLGLI